MESLVGKTVAHYKIIGLLGSGGMGMVYEGEDTDLGRHVAIKVLSADLQDDLPMLERFKREARAASSLNHPNICTVYSIEQHEGRPFIVMELIRGATLGERMGRHPFDVHQLLDFGIQIADALESAHSKGIAHRDIKPANFMVNDRGQVKILDFGLAKVEGGTATQKGEEVSQLVTEVKSGPLTVAGTVLGTVHYMSPEQARGQLTDARTDLFSLGAVLYQMATGETPFPGDTDAVVFESILNRDPKPLAEVNPSMPQGLGQILEKALEKDRQLRYQTATELKTDLLRLKKKLDSGQRRAAGMSDSKAGAEKAPEKSVAVLYFENLSGAKEDEYFRDGITEDIITELSKIEGLKINPRSMVLAFRDKPVTSSQVGQQLGSSYVLEGSIRRAGDRLRITTQLVDAASGYPVWSERYDREMKDVFEVQDEIARKIAEALRIKLSRQEQEAIAAKPTDNLQAYDLYLRGRSYARRLTRQDLEFALQMLENAVTQDSNFALAYAAIANVCAYYHAHYAREDVWIHRARAAAERAMTLQPDVPEVMVAQAWILYARGQYEEMVAIVRSVVARKPDCEGAYYLLLRGLYASGKYQEVASIAEQAIEASGTDYNVYVPIMNSLGALGKSEAKKNVRQRLIQAMEAHVREIPEDARARVLLGAYYAEEGREDDAMRESNLAMLLRPNEAMVLYNASCTFCTLNKKAEALDALTKAWRAGFRDSDWVRRDPDLSLIHGEPEFEKMYPEKAAGG
ncbi:MAG TPA: protein kinase [Thermoanaerobaculia bacterium]|nr:protein kinase [Thermoanaerobaculia bacterium]